MFITTAMMSHLHDVKPIKYEKFRFSGSKNNRVIQISSVLFSQINNITGYEESSLKKQIY